MRRSFTRVLVFTLLMAIVPWVDAQEKAGIPKPLATGVLNVLQPKLDARDSYTLPLQLPGLDAEEYQPNFVPVQQTLYGQTRKIVLFRDVWGYEFAFLGLRQIEINGKTVWYLVYRVRNTGKSLTYEQVKEDPRFDHIKYDLRRDEKNVNVTQFLPRFSLEGWASQPNGEYRRVAYRDQIIPDYVRLIQQREDANRHLLNTYEMSQANIPVSTDPTDPGIWGVAVWENVDPSIDYVSVFVSGLTNAYRIEATPDGKIGFKYRTLQLNFWRPGDTAMEVRDSIDYGIPLVDSPNEQIEICRRYQLPGPVLSIYRVDKDANQNVLVAEPDAEFSLQTFKSALVEQLNGGQLPESVAKAMAAAGVSVANDVAIQTEVNDVKWSLKDAGGTDYLLKIEPQFWEPTFGNGIRFIKRLDHIWIYR